MPLKYRIIGFKLNEAYELVRREVHHDRFDGDNSACSAKSAMQRNGYSVVIKPTPGLWTETLEVPT